MAQFVLIGLGLALWLVPAAGAASAAQPLPVTRDAVTSTTRDFLDRPLDAPGFQKGLALVKDRKESVRSRRMILDKIHASRRRLDSSQARALLAAATALAKDEQESATLAGEAIGAMASLNLMLEERGELTPAQARAEAPFLMKVAGDPRRERGMRGRAIRALGDLKAAEAVPLLRTLLADPATDAQPEVARNGALALARLSPETALGPLTQVISRTADRAVFGSAAFALGQLKTADAMAALVRAEERYPDSDSCAAALAGMEGPILAVLANPADPNLEAAIRASANLWKKSQRERVVPLLHGLLSTAPAAARAAAVERLIMTAGALEYDAERRELQTILGEIENQSELSAQAGRIRGRLAAKPLKPSGRTVPAPAMVEE